MKKSYMYFLLVIVIAIIFGIIWFYSQKHEEGAIKIGASLPLFNSSYGSGCLTGMQLAQKEINDAGGINGKKLELTVEDDRCDSKEGISVVNKLIYTDNVNAMVGPLCSNVASSVLTLLQDNKVPSIILASKAGLTKDRNYIFRITAADDAQGSFAARYIFNDLGKSKIAVMYVKNDWGQGIRDIFVERFKELGGTIAFDEGVEQGSADLKSTLVKLKNTDPEAIYFPAFPIEFLTGLKQMKELGINKPIISGDAIEIKDVLNSNLAEGVMYAIGKYNEPEAFKQKVKNSLNQDSNFVTPICYDAVNVLKSVMEKKGTDKKKIRDGVSGISFVGVSNSKIEFDNKGELKNSLLEIKIIRNKKSEVIKSE